MGARPPLWVALRALSAAAETELRWRLSPAAAHLRGTAPAHEGSTLSCLVWNIQYAAGRSERFFYDGGEAVHVSPSEVEAAISAIAKAIDEADVDLALLQEVDVGSRRTRGVDQIHALATRLRWPVVAQAAVHDVRHLPWPPTSPMGRVHMAQATLSRVAIERATRLSLPGIRESAIGRALNLRRADLETTLPFDGASLSVHNVHLSAFSRGDGTLERQLAAIEMGLPARSWVVVGDFNALPPGDDAARLGLDAADYPEARSPLAPWYDRGWGAVPDPEAPKWRTWLPYGSDKPERMLDHVFVSPDLEVTEIGVVPMDSCPSDHLPIRFVVRRRQ